jgi:ActR/RegA family two-component response regulator
MAAVAVSPRTLEHPDVTRWVVVVTGDPLVQRRTCRAMVRAGFAVEVAVDTAEALRLLEVITPALVVVDEDLPGAGDLLDRARAVGVDSASHGDVVGEELAQYRERNRGELFR